MAETHHRLNLTAAAASISVAALLVALKAWAVLATGALSVAASLVDSFLDLMVAIANLAAIRYAARPADHDHSFGHTAVEDIAALSQAAVVAGSAVVILWNAIERAVDPVVLGAERAGIVVMLVSLLATGGLVLFQRRVAALTGSKVVAADALHYVSDFLPALAAIVALAASRYLGVVFLDPLLATFAALWLLRSAWSVGRPAFDAIMDREAPDDLVERIRAAVADVPGAKGTHDLKTRVSGKRLFVQIHVEIDGNLSLRDAHQIGEAVRRRILRTHDDVEVIVHQDPV